MSSGRGQTQPQLGATFYPGGVDDFYIPELVAPAPQRALSEVPEQIQQNLAHLEFEAASSGRLSALQSPTLPKGMQDWSRPPYRDRSASVSQVETLSEQSRAHASKDYGNEQERGQALGGQEVSNFDQPSFSPFPWIQNRPANVPPSDEEKESILESARIPVLNSNDAEMQLTWAQDALAYVEVATQNEIRILENQPPRSQTPHVEHQLRLAAVDVVSFLADQHHPKAEFMRGTWLEFGKFGFRMDKKEAFRCYSRAAQNHYARAEYRMGNLFESSNDIEKAVKHYSIGMDAHDSACLYRLGMMTLLGQHGRTQDYRRGIDLVKVSAENADENAPQGAYVLGMLQARELSQVSVPEQYLPFDINGARYNVEKAAYLGFAKAQTKMGAAYELCQLGCDFDPALSLHYNNLAARQGEPEADMAISKWFLSGYEGVFRKNEELAFTYAQRAAQAGLPTAEFALGYFYEIGIYVSANLMEARSWYTKAAEHGNKDATARIEGITRSKTLSRKDHDKLAVAKIQSQRASRKGNRSNRLSFGQGSVPAKASEVVNMPEVQRPYSVVSAVIPYPTQTGFSTRLPAKNPSLYRTPDLRPSSGFGADPDVRPNSAAAMGGIQSNINYGSPSISSVGSPRPCSSMADAGHGRGSAAPFQMTPSNPVPQGYRLPGAGTPGPPMTMNKLPPLPPSKLDIGFTAPLDPSGADRRTRLQSSDSSDPRLSTPSLNAQHDVRHGRTSSASSAVPQPQMFHGGHRPSYPPTSNNRPDLAGRPPRNASLPVTSGSRPAPTPPPANLVSRPPAQTPSNNVAPKPPGKGPKTFDEMGVPQGKKDDECIVM